MPALKAMDMNTWSTISAARSPTSSPAKRRSFPRKGRFDRSTTASTRAPPLEASAEAMRTTPALSPRASPRHCP